jgi:proline racemase
VGLRIVPEHAAEFAALGRRITDAAAEQFPVVHPTRPELHTVTFTCFTSGPLAGGHGRNTTVILPGRLDRSACGTATSARLAVLHARDQLAAGQDYIHESIIGTTFTGRIEGLTKIGDTDAVRPSITGRAWITGTHQIGRHPADPLGRGFGLGDTWLGAEQRWSPT